MHANQTAHSKPWFAKIMGLVVPCVLLGCHGIAGEPMDSDLPQQSFTPHTDPQNKGGWVLVPEVSDEFNGPTLDTEKWHVQGTDDHYNNHFMGRAPSQFVPRNARVRDGELQIVTKWEPDFPFTDKINNGNKYENITTAAVITKAEFRYGYMETRCKAADGPISSAFWAIGGNGELDVFEHFGRNPKNPESDQRYHTSFHDWRDPESPTWSQRVWTNDHLLDFRIGEDYHVYGLEWDPNFISIYIDGRLIRHISRTEIGDNWVADGMMKVWLDCEFFPWEMNPADVTAEDFPGEGLIFNVDYVRIWQRSGDATVPVPNNPENLLANPSFEAGSRGWVLDGDTRVISNKAQDGRKVVALGESSSTVSQTVNVQPNTTYILSTWARLPGTNGKDVWENAWLGVKDYGGEPIRRTLFRSDFYRSSLEFTTGPDSDTATIFFTNDTSTNRALADAFELYESIDLTTIKD
ncbi:family 16 glycosylhydrolase [Algisphaera agarilytica]|uniref:Beta-glucanase (GH16 family) n=1 Tax=Algisphaera agarilytica TaxID=1385975 RepID=A0A7X0H7A4_9BACT|nr:family 16 glycosylhydrolase [Algisphaera agarilytica]MBB6429144.1 beta-glucanase (GH16 family) [Algisphaera agarilytica]